MKNEIMKTNVKMYCNALIHIMGLFALAGSCIMLWKVLLRLWY